MRELEPIDIQALLNRYHLRPSKGLGQNFLSDDWILAEIVESAELMESSAVLEIGPGLGSLTRHLCEQAGKVVAVELDRRMIAPLQAVLAPWNNVTIVQSDVLEFDPAPIFGAEGYSVVANIPYYITSAVIRHLLSFEGKPHRMVLTVQEEVAERICAAPGKLSLLALSVQIFGEAFIPMQIPANAFTPAPKVDSAVVRIDLYDTPLVPTNQMDAFFRMAKAGFGQKRKTLRNALSSNLHIKAEETERLLSMAEIDPMRRAETLSIEEWLRLIKQ